MEQSDAAEEKPWPGVRGSKPSGLAEARLVDFGAKGSGVELRFAKVSRCKQEHAQSIFTETRPALAPGHCVFNSGSKGKKK